MFDDQPFGKLSVSTISANETKPSDTLPSYRPGQSSLFTEPLSFNGSNDISDCNSFTGDGPVGTCDDLLDVDQCEINLEFPVPCTIYAVATNVDIVSTNLTRLLRQHRPSVRGEKTPTQQVKVGRPTMASSCSQWSKLTRAGRL